ncbi:hypothetical protein JXO59_14210 [candidate division KSB1 bacterium]|nr:hypothetical protein [candidate division KSB1 bacterium]
MRALPYTYRHVSAEKNTTITFNIPGEAGGTWHLLRQQSTWHLQGEISTKAQTTVIIPPDIAWRLFTRGMAKTDAEQYITIRGDAALGENMINMRCVMG